MNEECGDCLRACLGVFISINPFFLGLFLLR